MVFITLVMKYDRPIFHASKSGKPPEGLTNTLAIVTYCTMITYNSCLELLYTYRIAGKFGGENIWQIYLFRTFGKKKFGE